MLCLDAPLAAAGWAFALAASREPTPAPPRWPEVAALFSAVWLIYLGDRLHDARRADRSVGAAAPGFPPPRHAWARDHQGIFVPLLGVAGLMGLATLPLLTPATWTAAAFVVMATAIYFLIFRGGNRIGIPCRPFLPAKETAIALCFTSGVAIAASSGSPAAMPPLSLAALAFLVFGNCLLISRNEAIHDAREDPAAYFSSENALPWLPEAALLSALGFAGISSWRWGYSPAAAALTAIAGLTFVLARIRRPSLVRHTQSLADGLHLLTWVFVFVF